MFFCWRVQYVASAKNWVVEKGQGDKNCQVLVQINVWVCNTTLHMSKILFFNENNFLSQKIHFTPETLIQSILGRNLCGILCFERIRPASVILNRPHWYSLPRPWGLPILRSKSAFPWMITLIFLLMCHMCIDISKIQNTIACMFWIIGLAVQLLIFVINCQYMMTYKKRSQVQNGIYIKKKVPSVCQNLGFWGF